MRVRAFLGLLLALTNAGCGVIYSRSTATGLERDLSLLHGGSGFTDTAPGCGAIEGTRSGYCLYETNEPEVGSLVGRLGLSPVTLDASGAGAGVAPASELVAGCLSQPGFENPRRLVAYESERRDERLRLENGTAFEYLLVLFDPVGGGMCIQAAYAYG